MLMNIPFSNTELRRNKILIFQNFIPHIKNIEFNIYNKAVSSCGVNTTFANKCKVLNLDYQHFAFAIRK